MGEVPKVAIAMAVFDDERYLPLALEALCAQTFREFHLTVHDDGSSDRSAEIAEGYAGRIPLRVVRGPHRGRHFAKQAAWDEAVPAPYLLVMDSDVAPPPDALARMVVRLDADPSAAAVSARTLAFRGRCLGPSQAFLERFFFDVNAGADDQGRWIVGGCVLLRRSALDGVEIRADVGEDNDLSEKLRARWRLLAPRDLIADHYGVPTTVLGVLRRFERDGVRVRSLLRTYPGARQLGNVARLVPLPLAAAALVGLLAGQPWLAAASAAALAGYMGALLVASRRVPATIADRLGGTLLFTFGNVGFGWGYLREALRGRARVMREPARRF
jgi:glycosyltransferase involved in cell wall biosynthesis